jgi:hypothetical protein
MFYSAISLALQSAQRNNKHEFYNVLLYHLLLFNSAAPPA